MKTWLGGLLALAISGAPDPVAAASRAAIRAPQDPAREQDIEVQTRGPVHEAFADLIAFDAEPGPDVGREPPPAIEEIAPDQRPEGDEATWIAGYWAWDDDEDGFLWVSGVWRVPPPGHTWVPGYWHRSTSGWRWVQGIWTENEGAADAEVTYLAAPPESLEAGPSSPPPSEAYFWAPGCWTWMASRYAWRPGSWIVADPDWMWIPSCYQWTPCGHVFIDGHWDHLVARRGVLFAPVIFRRSIASRVGYVYTPSIAIDLGVLSLHLFSRPRYHHYYFGDWYEPACWDRGIYPTFAFHMSVYGYDPIYQHDRFEHRNDVARWESTVHADFNRRREDERARPPRSWVAQQSSPANRGEGQAESAVLARPVKELPAQRGSRIRLEPVPDEDRKKIAASGEQRRRATSERARIEGEAASRAPDAKERASKPVTAKLPKAPSVGRAAGKMRPPAAPTRPAPDDDGEARPGRGENGERGERPAPPPVVAPRPDGTPGSTAEGKARSKRRPDPQLPRKGGKPRGEQRDGPRSDPPAKPEKPKKDDGDE